MARQQNSISRELVSPEEESKFESAQSMVAIKGRNREEDNQGFHGSPRV